MNKITDKPRDAGELCQQCGICCMLLSARVYDDEIGNILKRAKEVVNLNYSITDFVHKENVQLSSEKQHLIINMPCCFFRGTPFSKVFCTIYAAERPKVCKSYFCKIALRYKLHLIELPEALQLLKESYADNNVGVFNWLGSLIDPSEDVIYKAEVVNICADTLRNCDYNDEQIERLRFLLEDVPKYKVKSVISELMLNYFLYSVDSKNIDLDLLLDESSIDFNSLTKKELDLTNTVTRHILNKFRSFYDK